MDNERQRLPLENMFRYFERLRLSFNSLHINFSPLINTRPIEKDPSNTKHIARLAEVAVEPTTKNIQNEETKLVEEMTSSSVFNPTIRDGC